VRSRYSLRLKPGIVTAFLCAAEIKKHGLLCSGDEWPFSVMFRQNPEKYLYFFHSIYKQNPSR